MKDGWEYRKIGDIASFLGGYTPKKEELNSVGGIPYFKVSDMNRPENLVTMSRTDLYVTDAKKTFPAGSIIFPKNGGAIYTGKLRFLTQSSVIDLNTEAILADERYIIKEFLFYLLNEVKVSSFDNGGGLPSVNMKKMAAYEVLLPPLSVQQSIVEYLDSAFAKIDAMKVNAEKALSEAKSLFQASLKSLLEPKDGWERKTLLDVVDENSSISYGIVQPGDDVPNGVPVVRPVDLASKNISLTKNIKRTAKENSDAYKRTILKGKEILLCVRGTTGVISMTDESLKDCNVTRGLVPLRITDDTLRNFLYFALLAPIASDFIQHNTRGAALKQINIADVKLVPVYLPSSNEQQSIVNTLETVENKVIQLQSNYDQICKECDALKQALLKQVFE